MPTYGMALLCVAVHVDSLPMPWLFNAILIGGTFTFTALIPLLLILYLKHIGKVCDLYINDYRERTLPYTYTSVCYGFWCCFLSRLLHMPLCIVLIAVGATLSLVLVTLINRRWKISAHLSGMGGLLGGIASYLLCIAHIPAIGLVCAMLTLTLLLMYARIYLRAHTPEQVVAGLLLGLACTFLPNLIYSYVVTL